MPPPNQINHPNTQQNILITFTHILSGSLTYCSPIPISSIGAQNIIKNSENFKQQL